MLTRPIWNAFQNKKWAETGVRLFSINIPALQKASDPIQQLFVDKIREYSQKSKSAGGKLVEASPEIERELKAELAKAASHYGGGSGVDMTKFPDFKFQDPKVDPINLQQ